MAQIKSSYLVSLSVIGVIIFGGAVGLVAATSASVVGVLKIAVLMIAFTILSAWFRIELAPSSYIDLTPFVVFMTLLLVGPSVALFAAVFSALVSLRFFARNPWHDVAAGMAEEGMAVLAAVVIAVLTRIGVGDLAAGERFLAFFLTVAVYVVVRLVLAAVRSKVAEGIDAFSFVRNAGKFMMAHLVILAVLAFLVLTFLYEKVGLLTVPLATLALFEMYAPWKLIGDQRDSLSANLSVIAQAIDLQDEYTFGHIHRVETIAVRTARSMRLSEAEVRKVRWGAWMHDIGKVSVSGKIIRKPSALDPAEWAIIKQHPVIGAGILQPVELLSEAAEIVRHHHENFDGSGYPDGLKGEYIPIGSRILMVADAFDAMTTDRPYRRRRPKEEALLELRRRSGSQFDPKVVEAFESIINLVEPPADQSAPRAA